MEITVSVSQRNWQLLNEIFNTLKLRRDAYLNECLPAEIDVIESLPVSEAAGNEHARLLTKLKNEGRQRVTILLDPGIAERLTRACTAKNIPRNAFFDAFVWFLCVRLIGPALVVAQPRKTLGLSQKQLNDKIKQFLVADQFEIDNALEPIYYAQSLVWTSERLEHQQKLIASLS